jgi:hypothetical protein
LFVGDWSAANMTHTTNIGLSPPHAIVSSIRRYLKRPITKFYFPNCSVRSVVHW